MYLAQFVCAPQFFKTPTGLCGHTVHLSYSYAIARVVYSKTDTPNNSYSTVVNIGLIAGLFARIQGHLGEINSSLGKESTETVNL
jgi:hypothetical protein